MALEGIFLINPRSPTDPGLIDYLRSTESALLDCIRGYNGSELEKFRILVNMVPDKNIYMKDLLVDATRLAIHHGVKEFELDLTVVYWIEQPLRFTVVPVLNLPDEFYDRFHQGLESLRLSAVGIKVLQCNHFASLRTVSLGWVSFQEAELKHLAAQAPLLEDLRLHRCRLHKVELASNTLQTLTLEECHIDKDKVLVAAPNLRVFVISGRPCELDLESAAANLIEASIRFDLAPKNRSFVDDNIYRSQVIKSFWNVKVLTLCSYTLQAFSYPVQVFHDQLFTEVECLMVKAASFDNLRMLQGCNSILRFCPRIKRLEIDFSREDGRLNAIKAPSESGSPYSSYRNPLNVSVPCLERTLKFVSVKGFANSEFIYYFLSQVIQRGKVLESVFVYTPATPQNKLERLQELLGGASPYLNYVSAANSDISSASSN